MNPTFQLKVCGLTRIDQILDLISMNIDFLGFIFYKQSPRYVLNHLSLEAISKIPHHHKVGVFVNESLDKIIEIIEKVDLNLVQLHGDESDEYVTELKKRINPNIKIIKVFRIGTTIENIESRIQNLQTIVDYILFDTDSKSFGGTGKQFNWSLLNEFKIEIPYFLSGGISEENFDKTRILLQQPFALDINSKFESEPGIKNLERIKLFKSNQLQHH